MQFIPKLSVKEKLALLSGELIDGKVPRDPEEPLPEPNYSRNLISFKTRPLKGQEELKLRTALETIEEFCPGTVWIQPEYQMCFFKVATPEGFTGEVIFYLQAEVD